MFYFQKKKLYLVVNVLLTTKNTYEMVPMKIFLENIQTGDLYLLEPEVIK